MTLKFIPYIKTQVWFQNSRAKYRRGISQPGTGGSCDGNGAGGGVGMPSQTHHLHSSTEEAVTRQEDSGATTSINALNSMISNDETDSDSLMEGIPVS